MICAWVPFGVAVGVVRGVRVGRRARSRPNLAKFQNLRSRRAAWTSFDRWDDASSHSLDWLRWPWPSPKLSKLIHVARCSQTLKFHQISPNLGPIGRVGRHGHPARPRQRPQRVPRHISPPVHPRTTGDYARLLDIAKWEGAQATFEMTRSMTPIGCTVGCHRVVIANTL